MNNEELSFLKSFAGFVIFLAGGAMCALGFDFYNKWLKVIGCVLMALPFAKLLGFFILY